MSIPATDAYGEVLPQEVRLLQDYHRGLRADDRLVELANGTQVKESNYRGIDIGGRRLYYRASPHFSMDPWTRGAVSGSQVVVLANLDKDTEFPMVVYRLTGE